MATLWIIDFVFDCFAWAEDISHRRQRVRETHFAERIEREVGDNLFVKPGLNAEDEQRTIGARKNGELLK